MKVTTKNPKIEYPYLAVWVGVGGEMDAANVSTTDILLISIVESDNSENQSDTQIQVQPLLGGSKAYIAKNENEYQALPIGYTVEIVQSTQK